MCDPSLTYIRSIIDEYETSPLVENIRQVIDNGDDLTNKIAKIAHLINNEYSIIRLNELRQYLIDKSSEARSILDIEFYINLIDGNTLRITALVERDERLKYYIRDNIDEDRTSFSHIRIIPDVWIDVTESKTTNSITLNNLNCLYKFCHNTIRVDRDVILMIINRAVFLKLDRSIILDSWDINIEFDKTESHIEIIINISVN